MSESNLKNRQIKIYSRKELGVPFVMVNNINSDSNIRVKDGSTMVEYICNDIACDATTLPCSENIVMPAKSTRSINHFLTANS